MQYPRKIIIKLVKNVENDFTNNFKIQKNYAKYFHLTVCGLKTKWNCMYSDNLNSNDHAMMSFNIFTPKIDSRNAHDCLLQFCSDKVKS